MSESETDDLDSVVEFIQKQIDIEEESLYSKKVIHEYRNPKNVGRMADPDASGIITGPCRDTMEIYLKFKDGRIADIIFMTDGCGPSIACGSMLTKMAKGKGIEEVTKIITSSP